MGGFENQHNAEPSTQDTKERGEEAFSELDKETSQKEEPWKDKAEIVKDTLRKHLKENPEKKKDEGYLKKLTAKASEITYDECQKQDITLNDEQKDAIHELFEDFRREITEKDLQRGRDDGMVIPMETKTRQSKDNMIIQPEKPKYRDDGMIVPATPKTQEKKEATTKLGEITSEQLKQAIKSMPDEILVEARSSKNPAMKLQTATTNLRSEIDKSIMHALNVKEGTFDSSSVAQWAIEKVRTLDREDVIQGTKIQISEEEKRKLLQDFIHANQ